MYCGIGDLKKWDCEIHLLLQELLPIYMCVVVVVLAAFLRNERLSDSLSFVPSKRRRATSQAKPLHLHAHHITPSHLRYHRQYCNTIQAIRTPQRTVTAARMSRRHAVNPGCPRTRAARDAAARAECSGVLRRGRRFFCSEQRWKRGRGERISEGGLDSMDAETH